MKHVLTGRYITQVRTNVVYDTFIEDLTKKYEKAIEEGFRNIKVECAIIDGSEDTELYLVGDRLEFEWEYNRRIESELYAKQRRRDEYEKLKKEFEPS